MRDCAVQPCKQSKSETSQFHTQYLKHSQGKPDEHWAIRTGAIDGPSPKMEKQIFMRSKPDWVPDAASESHETMPG